MSSIYYGSVFAMTVASLVGAAECSGPPQQEKAKTAEAPSGVEEKLAADEPPGRSEESQPQQAELDQEKPNGEVVEIPLERIRRGAPGSRQLRDLEPELFVYRDTPEKIARYSTREGRAELEEIVRRAKEESLVLAIEHAMSALSTGKSTKPAAGFAVKGIDRAALQGVYDVLVKGEEPTDLFRAGNDVSVVFFAYPVQPRVGLDRIELVDGKVRIHYMLLSHGSRSVSWYLALIPCGKLPPGQYRVEMVRSSAKEKEYNQREFPPVEAGAEVHIVCRPFSFTVRGQASD